MQCSNLNSFYFFFKKKLLNFFSATPFYFLKQIVPNFFPSWCVRLLTLNLFISFSKIRIYFFKYKAIYLLHESSKFKNYSLINIIIVFPIVSFSWYFIGIVNAIDKEMFFAGHLLTFFFTFFLSKQTKQWYCNHGEIVIEQVWIKATQIL